MNSALGQRDDKNTAVNGLLQSCNPSDSYYIVLIITWASSVAPIWNRRDRHTVLFNHQNEGP